MKFGPSARVTVVEHMADGCTLAEAATRAQVPLSTVKYWITRGKREDIGPYHDFDAAIAAARDASERACRFPQTDGPEASTDPEPMTPAEFRHHLEGAVRAGSPPAMKLWADRFLVAEEPEKPESAIARLAVHGDDAA